MKLLALEAATQACSAALWLDGEVNECFELAPRRQAELLLPMVSRLLAGSGLTLTGLDGIAVGSGPGAFTGVRGAMAAAQGLALGANLPAIGISNLQTLAAGAFRQRVGAACLTVQDARMGEVYWAAFAGNCNALTPVMPDTVGLPAAVDWSPLENPENEAGQPDWLLAGNGWAAYPELLDRLPRGLAGVVQVHPQARDVAALAAPLFAAGQGVAPELLVPRYVRNNVARKPKPSAAG